MYVRETKITKMSLIDYQRRRVKRREKTENISRHSSSASAAAARWGWKLKGLIGLFSLVGGKGGRRRRNGKN